MSTTIRVGDDLHSRLKSLKNRREASSFEELLEEMLEREAERISMFGADEELEEWTEDDRTGFEER